MERGEGGRGGGGGGGGTGRFTIPSKGLSSPSSYVFAQEITDGRGSVKREIHLGRLCLEWNRDFEVAKSETRDHRQGETQKTDRGVGEAPPGFTFLHF